MTRRALALAVVCLLLACSSALVAGGDGPADVQSVSTDTELRQSTSLSGLQGPPDTDATVTRIQVLPNGTALWSLTIRMQLDSEEAETEFAAFQEAFEANRSEFVDSYRNTTSPAVSAAENLTGRAMAATGFEAETGTEAVPRQWGYVTYRFRWKGFAPVENGSVLVGDVFEGGLFVEEGGILVVRSPDGYQPTAVEPEPDETSDGELRWDGPVSFGDRRPSAEFAPSSDDSGPTDDGPTDGDTTDDGPDTDTAADGSGGGLPTGLILFGTAGIAVLAGVGAFYFYRRRQRSGPADSPPPGGATDDGAATAAGGQETAGSDEMPELATDEDRVMAALAAADGRMRQSELADQLDWSPSKTSRVLSDMADEGDIEKLRIGRENVIDLADDNG